MYARCITFSVAFLIAINVELIFAQSRCVNPNRRNGYCTSIYECPALVATLQRVPLTNEDRRFVQESQCQGGVGRLPHVCCNEDGGYNVPNPGGMTERPPNTNQERTTAAPSNGRGNILPSTPQCGTTSTGNKIYNGKNTGLYEFPWMVLLEYRQANGQKVLNCGGSLINQRYVLTAAHCVTGEVEREVGQLDSVRLGEYDTSTTVDCVDDECADPILQVGVEEIIPHSGYQDGASDRHNDIALIRLNRDIPFTEFIRPICLPSAVNMRRSTPGSELTVAGWGRTLRVRMSAIKQKLDIPVYDQNRCAQQFLEKSVRLDDSQLCAGGRFAEDSCDGDSGGPLMKTTNNFWTLEGIVSFGHRCGLEGWPAVYTRVSSFEDWIRNNMKP